MKGAKGKDVVREKGKRSKERTADGLGFIWLGITISRGLHSDCTFVATTHITGVPNLKKTSSATTTNVLLELMHG